MRKIYTAFALVLLLVTGNVIAQTLPSPFDLSTGTYSFTSWDSLAPAGTYPPNMKFYATTSNADTLTLGGTVLWPCKYNALRNSRFRGLNEKGLLFLRTSNGTNLTTCDTSATSGNTYASHVILTANTLGQSQVNLSFKAGVTVVGTGLTMPTVKPARVFNIQAQYRVRTSATDAWINLPAMYSSVGKPVNDSATITATLPTSANNKALVDVRLMYYENTTVGGGGTRPSMRIDDIVLSSTTTGLAKATSAPKMDAFPNPTTGILNVNTFTTTAKTITLRNVIGVEVKSITTSDALQQIDISNLERGIYFVQVVAANGAKQVQRITKY